MRDDWGNVSLRYSAKALEIIFVMKLSKGIVFQFLIYFLYDFLR